jgi:glycosyltransferase involved in cell wall biosynthesis
VTKDFKVSVVIPVYNAEEYLKRAVKSLVSISEINEIILVDDGSTDSSFLLCNKLSSDNDKIKVLQHHDQHNKGAAASRNLGIRHAKSEFISFLDADDYYLPHRFENDKKIFGHYEDAEGVYGCSQEKFESEKAADYFFSTRDRVITAMTEIIAPENLFKSLIFGGYGEFHTSTITLKKSAFYKVGFFNEKIRYVEDTELWLKLSLKCRLYCGNISEPQSIRVVHENNSIHQFQKIAPYRSLMYQELFIWCINESFPFNIKNDLFNALYRYSYGENYSVKRLFFEQAKKNIRLIFTSFFIKKIHQLFFTGIKA